MKLKTVAILALGVLGAPNVQGLNQVQPSAPTIIWDTDMVNDCDDVGALAVLAELHRKGEANVIGLVSSAGTPYSAIGLDILATYYGMKLANGDPVPVAHNRNHPTFLGIGELARDNSTANLETYTKPLAEAYGWDHPNVKKNGRTSTAQEAVAFYRTALRDAVSPVTIVTGGPLLNLYYLLNSPGDHIDTRTGAALVAAKVSQLVIAGGKATGGWSGRLWTPPVFTTSFNFENDIDNDPGDVLNGIAAQSVFANWPTKKVHITNVVGSGLTTFNSWGLVTSPAARAYDLWQNAPGHRNWHFRESFDAAGILAAVRGPGSLLDVHSGRMVYDPTYNTDGRMVWSNEGSNAFNTEYWWPKAGVTDRITTVIQQLMDDAETNRGVVATAPPITPDPVAQSFDALLTAESGVWGVCKTADGKSAYCKQNAGGTHRTAFASVGTNNYTVQSSILLGSLSNRGGVLARYSSATEHYNFEITSSSDGLSTYVKLFKRAGTSTAYQVGPTYTLPVTSVNVWRTIKLNVNATTITGSVLDNSGVWQQAVTSPIDSALASGRPGLSANNPSTSSWTAHDGVHVR